MVAYSVLMSVYCKENAEYLRLAMDSMWNQSVATNDFVLVCDGKLTPELDEVIDEMLKNHKQLNVIRIDKNGGLGNALNIGLDYCKNEIVARMDSDDISISDRCERQLKILCTNMEIGICSGTVLEFKDDIDCVFGKRKLPITQEEIKYYSRKRNPFNHPSVMFRRSLVKKAGGYDETFHLFEDYYLWIRMLQCGSIGYNIIDPLLYMRTPKNLYSRRGGKAYALSMLRFHRWVYSSGWSNLSDYLFGAIPHAMICVLPNSIRKVIYMLIHR